MWGWKQNTGCKTSSHQQHSLIVRQPNGIFWLNLALEYIENVFGYISSLDPLVKESDWWPRAILVEIEISKMASKMAAKYYTKSKLTFNFDFLPFSSDQNYAIMVSEYKAMNYKIYTILRPSWRPKWPPKENTLTNL